MATPKHPREVHEAIARIRGELDLPRRSEDAFEAVLEVVDYIASREDLVRVRDWDLEPDNLARRLFGDPQQRAIRAVAPILAGVTETDLRRLETILLRLEKLSGRALATAPNRRLLVDGAVLADVGFLYNRKHREVLAAQAFRKRKAKKDLLPSLIGTVDGLFTAGRPRYLWRLGPEFGVDDNVRLLLARKDDFIVGSPYSSRATAAARHVLRWQDLAGFGEVGECLDDDRFDASLRLLVRRTGKGRARRSRLLLTNLSNTSWEDVLRLYRNRSGKYSSAVEIVDAEQVSWTRKASAIAMILALLAFRNVNSWAGGPKNKNKKDTTSYRSEITVSGEDELHLLSLFESKKRQETRDFMEVYLGYLEGLLDGDVSELRARRGGLAYELSVSANAPVTAMAEGLVYFVDRDGEDSAGATVYLHHGRGMTSVYSNLGSVDEAIKMGDRVAAGQAVGNAIDASSPIAIEARLAKRYADNGFEPQMADIISVAQNYVLDPLGLLKLLPEPTTDGEIVPAEFTTVSLRADRESADDRSDDYDSLPSLDDVDLFVLSSDELETEIIIAEPQDDILDDEFGFSDFEDSFTLVSLQSDELEDLS